VKETETMSKKDREIITDDEGARSFGVFLHELADGDAESELSVEMRDLVTELTGHAINTGQDATGAITLKIQFKVTPRRECSSGYTIDTKKPKPKRAGSTFYVTKGGNLTVEHPRQARLPLREVPATEIKDGAGEQPAVRSV
jgi:hypothetical protein